MVRKSAVISGGGEKCKFTTRPVNRTGNTSLRIAVVVDGIVVVVVVAVVMVVVVVVVVVMVMEFVVMVTVVVCHCL